MRTEGSPGSPSTRSAGPEDGAAAVLFLCSQQASYITGVTLPVDGGFLPYNAGSA